MTLREPVLIPLGVFALCVAIAWLLNRRARAAWLLWPRGLELTGPITRPDLSFDGDVVLGADQRFGTIQCRRLSIARGATVLAHRVIAVRVVVDGALETTDAVQAARRLDVRGRLEADSVRCPRVTLHAGSRATVMTLTGNTRLHRHPKAVAKGFFEEDDTKVSSKALSDTDRIQVVK